MFLFLEAINHGNEYRPNGWDYLSDQGEQDYTTRDRDPWHP